MRKYGFVAVIIFYLHSVLSIIEKIFGKIKMKYLPSRVSEAGASLEACSVGDGGGMAGLCPVHTM